MKLSSPTALAAAVAVLTLAGCTRDGSGASDDVETDDGDVRGSGGIVTPADAVDDPIELLARPRAGIAADITLDTCETRSGAVEANGTATNASGKRKDLVVSVAWVAPEGSDVLARATTAVTNTGSLTLLGIKVQDRLAGQVSCDATALAPGASTECAAVEPYVITEADTSAGMVHNVASALGEPTVCSVQPKAAKRCPGVKSNEDETVTATAGVPALDLVKRAGPVTDVNGSGRTDAGDTIVYEFSVSNVGTIPLVAIDVIDDKLSEAGVDVSCPRDELAPGTAMVCESDPYTITGADDAHGSVDNVATVEGETPGGGTVGSDPSTAVVSIERDPGELPNTGSGYRWWMPLVGLGLLAVGVGLTVAKPRRRTRHT